MNETKVEPITRERIERLDRLRDRASADPHDGMLQGDTDDYLYIEGLVEEAGYLLALARTCIEGREALERADLFLAGVEMSYGDDEAGTDSARADAAALRAIAALVETREEEP